MRFIRAGFALIVVACVAVPTNTGAAPTVAPSPPPAPVAPALGTEADYRRIEREIVDELNSARTNPRAYADVVVALLPYFDGKLLRRPGMMTALTNEGIAPAHEAIRVLRAQTAVKPLVEAAGLSQAARDHVRDQAHTGETGHNSSNGANTGDRIDRYGKWGASYSENIAYGRFGRGSDVVVNLIVDDGVPDRGHRHNIFDPSITVVGVACGPHPRFGSSCVIDHAGRFTKR